MAELKRWSALRGDFEAIGVTLVAISSGTVPETRAMMEKHDLRITVLSDESLEAIKRYNLVTKDAFVDRMIAIPATILIGADGTVLWTEQSSDFRVRPNEEELLERVRSLIEKP